MIVLSSSWQQCQPTMYNSVGSKLKSDNEDQENWTSGGLARINKTTLSSRWEQCHPTIYNFVGSKLKIGDEDKEN